MKFEGPAPETETRQVSLSFAAFIVAVAFVLFGIAMAVGTMTTNRTTDTPAPETVSADQVSSESVASAQPAVTQPVEDMNSNADLQDESMDQIDQQQTVQEPAEQVATVIEQQNSANPPANTAESEPVVTRNPSFPARHAAQTPTASTSAPANTVATLAKRN